MPERTAVAGPAKRRGRPPRTIDTGAVIAAVDRLFAAGGIDAVTVERTAAELGVSRATLYRTVPTKADLLGIHFEWMRGELEAAVHEATEGVPGAGAEERLVALIGVQIAAAVRMRDYFFIYFDGSRFPEGVYRHWRRWARAYEQVWIRTVAGAIDAGVLSPGDPLLTTRLILGQTIWVANWFRPREGFTPDQIQTRALQVLGLASSPPAPAKSRPRAR